MAIVIGFSIFILFLFLGVGFIAFNKIKSSTLNEESDTSIDENIQTAQEFLPFVDIKDGVIDMGEHNYVGIIECSSINYFLRTGQEQNMVDNSFMRYINSLTYRTVLFNQTRIMDNSDMLKKMQVELNQASRENANLAAVAEDYYNEMANLTNRIGNNKMKKKYVLVPFNDAGDLNSLNDKEKRSFSLDELRTRMGMLISGLEGVGVVAKPLGTKEIVELVYSTYNRDNYRGYKNLYNGEHLVKIVDGNTFKRKETTDELIDMFLHETQNKINNEISASEMVKNLEYGQIVEELGRLRELLDQDKEEK